MRTPARALCLSHWMQPSYWALHSFHAASRINIIRQSCLLSLSSFFCIIAIFGVVFTAAIAATTVTSGGSILVNASVNHGMVRVPKKSSFRSANAAQECNHVGFVVVHGVFEGGAVAAGRRMSGEGHHKRAQQAVSHRTCSSRPRRLSLKPTTCKSQGNQDRQRTSRRTIG
jgi:hypothetical protein